MGSRGPAFRHASSEGDGRSRDGACWTIVTPSGAAGAIATLELRAADETAMDAVLRALELGEVPVGSVSLRPLLGVDSGIAARWTPRVCHLMPHGGIGVLRALSNALTERGVLCAEGAEYPEAASPIEGHMLRALARAASPLAIELLLDQPRRWASGDSDVAGLNRILNRLIDPPLVVALGPPNIGKSTLVNTLSGRDVSIVADEPGTTRDHIGVWLNLDGFVVRYLDTPGLRDSADAIEVQARGIALAAAATADLLLLMGDAGAAPPEPLPGCRTLRVALRSDLGEAAWPHDVAVSAARGRGVAELASLIRETLVPSSALEDDRPWRFWAEAPVN